MNSGASFLTRENAVLAEEHLQRSDSTLAGLIKKYGPCELPTRPFHPFHALAVAVISQQLSAKAADSIVQRLSHVIVNPFQIQDFLSVESDQLRHAGLSARKVTCILDVARRINDGRLSFGSMDAQEDKAIIEDLVLIPGIGRWTAEMFLIFGLKRPDVLALTDAGLQRSFKMLYNDTPGHNVSLEETGNKWKPYRSVAAWYLWRHIDSNQ